MVLDPLTLIERLAALVPRPRVNLTTYHGGFAPAASYRERIVPEPPDENDEVPATRCSHDRPEQEPRVIRRILEHLGLDAEPPPIQPARPPPAAALHFA